VPVGTNWSNLLFVSTMELPMLNLL